MKMGKFEDLIKLARDGDLTALDTLETEYGASNLREQSESATAALKENEDYIRVGKFNSLNAEIDGSNLTLEDLNGVDSKDITKDLLVRKAEEKQANRAKVREDLAKEAGFESVDEYEKAMENLKQSQTKQRSDFENLGGSTASNSGGHTPPAEAKDPYEESLEAFNEAKTSGKTQDEAHGEAAEALMAAQHPAKEEAYQ